ncbi:hypothetical protein BDQ17DRAFT_989555 [Cyathus striatus]|nr:hypothetical protein BDQ17DRAFT_989555 [Cyathus striatus]
MSPRLGITLVNSEKITSLKAWLYTHQSFRHYLRHLWIEPWNDEDFDACVGILQQCTKVESIVCVAQMLEAAVGSSAQLLHLSCRSLTLPNSSSRTLPSLAGTPAGAEFLARLTHLRVMGQTAPSEVHFPNLTHLSYCIDATGDNVSHSEEMYPKLEKVILTQWRKSAGGVRISRSRSKNVFMFELPQKWSERTMWRDDVRGRGIWDL